MPRLTDWKHDGAVVGLDQVSVEHWSQRGLDPDTVYYQIDWESGGKDLTEYGRLEVVRRFYEENNPHIHKHPLQSAHEEFMDAFHGEVARLIEED